MFHPQLLSKYMEKIVAVKKKKDNKKAISVEEIIESKHYGNYSVASKKYFALVILLLLKNLNCLYSVSRKLFLFIFDSRLNCSMIKPSNWEPFKIVLQRQVPVDVGKPIPMTVFQNKHPKNCGDPWIGAYSKHGFWYKFSYGTQTDYEKVIWLHSLKFFCVFI